MGMGNAVSVGVVMGIVFNIDKTFFAIEKAIKEAGKLRTEGKGYVMHDADVCRFLFNV